MATPLRLLRLLPAITSTATLQFVVDEHLIFGTWMDPSLRSHANTTLPTWWTRGGLRWQWVLIIGYPLNYIFGALNLIVEYDQLRDSGAATWYILGLMFSVAHMFYIKMALGRIAAIEKGTPRGNVTVSLGRWLTMNLVRGLVTDLPAWVFWVVAALKAL